MRYYPSKGVEQQYRETLDAHPHSKERVGEQINRSRTQIALSKEILCDSEPKVRQPEVLVMPSAAECRALAEAFKSKATEAGLPVRDATILKNISHSLSSLASQLEMLAAPTVGEWLTITSTPKDVRL